MKNSILVLLLSLVGVSAFAYDQKLECADKAVEAATVRNFRDHGANTGSCGAKLLAAGDYLETYLVCESDETDPSEWIVVVEKNVFKNNKLAGKCGIVAVEAQYDSETPNFDSDDGVLKTKSCTMEDDDKKARCK